MGENLLRSAQSDPRSRIEDPVSGCGHLRPTQLHGAAVVMQLDRRRLQQSPRRAVADGQVSPQFDQKPSCQSHDADLSDPSAPAGKASPVPARQLASGLKPQPSPGQVNCDTSNVAVAGSANASLSRRLSALKGCRRQPRQRADLAAVAKATPSKLPNEDSRRGTAHTTKPHQASNAGDGRLRTVPKPVCQPRLEIQDLPMDKLVALDLPLQPRLQPRRQCRSVPDAHRLEPLEQALLTGTDAGPLTRQQPLDAVGQPGLLLLQGPQLSVRVAGVLLFRRGYPDHAPDFPLPELVSHKHREQPARIQSVCLGPPRAPVHLDRGRVHDSVLDAPTRQQPVKPETIPACLVAADDA